MDTYIKPIILSRYTVVHAWISEKTEKDNIVSPKKMESQKNCNRSEMSRIMRKPAFCICKNKDEDQLRGNREADQRLCFRYIDSTIPLLPKAEISKL